MGIRGEDLTCSRRWRSPMRPGICDVLHVLYCIMSGGARPRCRSNPRSYYSSPTGNSLISRGPSTLDRNFSEQS